MFKRGRGRESARADTRTKRNGDASVVLLNPRFGVADDCRTQYTCLIRRTHLTLASPRPPPIARVWTSLRATRNSTCWMDRLQEVLDEPHAGRRQPFVRRAPSSRSVLALVAADLYPRQRLRRPPLLLLRFQMGRSAELRILGRAVVCCCCLWPRATAAALRCSSCS